MQTVAISSQNPVKINATKKCFARVFPEAEFEFTTANVSSGVPDQPMADQTKQGCINRTTGMVPSQYRKDRRFW